MDARGSVMLVVKRSDDLVIQQTLRGQQVGSYFGNAVVAVDLNGDGWKDLLVGAPFYFSRHPEAGGAVYVYMNGRERFHSEASVVIQGSTVFAGFRTFGYSLAAGVDVDGNNYPDLLVGSLDDTVALLRSRPVIQLNNRLRVSPDVVDPNDCDFCLKPRLRFHGTRESVYSSILSGDISGSVECFVEGVALLCQLGNPFRSNQKVKTWSCSPFSTSCSTTVLLNPAETLFSAPVFQVQLFIKFEPSELALDTREIRSQLRLSTGHVIGEQAMKTTEDIGSLVVFTFQDYSDASSVLVQGKATLKLKTTKSTINMKSSPLLIDVNIYPESGLQQNSGAPLWIIVVSVLAGVLLLAVICLLLWKCRFFVRQEAWQTAVLQQKRIMGSAEQHQHVDDDGFLIQDQMTSTRNRNSQKHWVTIWTEIH
ncbi:hypothetical protein XENOCAPTIV_030003 [Xenoophorus captivus]|uniref:Integrin alpha-2 domain-containing protein n=1 Tax=Xenoophorus captivus TaxID=1517983 RepID=A0ABV0R6Z5_9TELE